MSKAQAYRDEQEPTVTSVAKALKGKAAGKRDEAVAAVTAVVQRATELGIKHESVRAIAVSLVMGDAKQLAATITTERTAGFNGNTGTSSHMAWVLHAIHKAENPWTPGGNNRLIGKEEFRAMKVRNGGHIPDGMSIKEAVAAGFLTADGKPVVMDDTALPADIQAKVDEMVALGVPEADAIRFARSSQ